MPAGDLVYALRTLRKSPIFALTAAATIALGIGASTAIFSVTNAVLLRPLPYRNPDRLVLAYRDNRKASSSSYAFSNADFVELRDGTKSVFDELHAIFTFRAFVPREDGSAEQISKAQVTTGFFRSIGARVALGRDFTGADAVPQPSQPDAVLPMGSVAILSYEYWQRRYGGDAGAIGREMLSSGQRGPQIVGVLSPGFKLLLPPRDGSEAVPDVWIANNAGKDEARRNLIGVRIIGRLKESVTLQTAQAQVDRVAAEQRKNIAGYQDFYVRLQPMHQHLVAQVRPVLLALTGAVLFLLLIACANVANLLLVRASVRQRELAVRSALGGGWWRLARQLLAEAALLAALGTLIGIFLAWIGTRALIALAPANLPRLESIAIDWRVIAFAAIAGLASAAAFGLVPALRASRPDVAQVLRGGGRSIEFGTGRTLRDSVVVVEVALSFVLLVGSGLLLRSFLALQRVDPGFRADGLLMFMAAREWPFTRQEGRQALLREVQERLRALPGVESVSAGLALPFAGGFPPIGLEWSTEEAPPEPGRPRSAGVQSVLPGYFETLRTRLLAGRTFTEADNVPGRNVIIIDEQLAAKAFPNRSAIGRRLVVMNRAALEVIGVVAHQRVASLAEPGPDQMYFTDAWMGVGVSRNWAVRTSGDPAKLALAVRAELAKIDRRFVITKMQPMSALLDREQAGTRFSLLLIAVFAAIAVLLACVGLYGVLSTVVRQRTPEIGVRMALGASPASVFGLVVGYGLRLGLTGLAIGLVAALGATRLIAGLLFGVKPADPSTFALTALLFLVVAGLACWAPARRAAALDPASSLREE